MFIVCWTDRVDGLFIDAWETCETREEAQEELDEHLFMLRIDRDLGNIEDVNPEDYRISEVTE
jgi:hypothetical protein